MSTAPLPPVTGRLRPGHWVALDLLVSLVLTVVTWLRVLDAARVFDPHHRGYARPGTAEVVTVLACVLVAGAAVGLRRLAPVAAAGAVFAAWAVVVAAAGELTIANLAGFQVAVAAGMLVYLVAAVRPPCTSAAVLASGLLGAGLSEFGSRELWNNLVLVALELAACWAVGGVVARFRAYGAALRRYQADLARAELAEERMRLARELHDVIAHSMSVVNVQAGYGRFVIGRDRAKAEQALTAIEAVSREAMVELRGLLTVLRGTAVGELAPAPRLADLGRLVASGAEAGVRVGLRVRGRVRPLPEGVELSAFRIVQEALTNVVRHAHTDAARVAVAYEEDRLVLEVTDGGRGGRGGPVGAGGHGLAGMAERVGLYGGRLEAGPLPGGGFRVRAVLPVLPAPPVEGAGAGASGTVGTAGATGGAGAARADGVTRATGAAGSGAAG
ncbi:sensor histidine kinase [Kitasatospora sp. NPDC056446]|uniref:sensor histidine kinase n=1 Tax=Kitasatospora sp. NPDC056446 TaxID=3345819 RepID=UPI0036C273F4